VTSPAALEPDPPPPPTAAPAAGTSPRVHTSHFTVSALHLDGATEATLTIEPSVAPGSGGGLVTVRPKGRRQTYTLSLALVAEMVAWRAAKAAAVGASNSKRKR
jgi:hypothetical protein